MGAPRAVGGETSFHTLLAAFRSRNCGGAYPRALCRHPAPVPASGTPGAVPAARRAWHHCSLLCPPPAERSCPLGLSHTPMTPRSAALMVVTSGRSMAAPLSTHWRGQHQACQMLGRCGMAAQSSGVSTAAVSAAKCRQKRVEQCFAPPRRSAPQVD